MGSPSVPDDSVLRPLGPEFVRQVVDYREAMLSECGGLGRMGERWKEQTVAHYEACYAAGTCRHFGAFVEGRLVGVAGAILRDHFPIFTTKVPVSGWIMDVYVEKPWRGRRLATRLTMETITWLKAQGVVEIRLVASTQAKELGIYQKLGFEFTNEMRLKG